MLLGERDPKFKLDRSEVILALWEAVSPMVESKF